MSLLIVLGKLMMGIEETRNGKYCVPVAMVSLRSRGRIPKNVQGMHALRIRPFLIFRQCGF